jgi:ketosteroid isomerase-like protein
MTANFEDWVAICETKARYCRCLDSKDWVGYADCFTEDFVLDTPPAGNITRGRDAAVKTVRGAVETAETAHQVHNPEISFAADGRSADVIWAMQDRVSWGEERRAKLGNCGHTGFGHYREHYVKCADGRWRIKTLKLSYLKMDFHHSPGHGPAAS